MIPIKVVEYFRKKSHAITHRNFTPISGEELMFTVNGRKIKLQERQPITPNVVTFGGAESVREYQVLR